MSKAAEFAAQAMQSVLHGAGKVAEGAVKGVEALYDNDTVRQKVGQGAAELASALYQERGYVPYGDGQKMFGKDNEQDKGNDQGKEQQKELDRGMSR